MSARFYQSTTPQENQSIKVNDALVRGNCTIQGTASAVGTFGCADLTCDDIACDAITSSSTIVATKNFGQKGGTSHVQITSASTTVDASGAGASRLFQVSTVNLTLAAAASANFLLLLPAGSLGTSPSYHNVVFSIYDYSGSYDTNGTPIAYIASIDPTQSRVRIVIKNVANAQSLNGVLKFNISIIDGSA